MTLKMSHFIITIASIFIVRFCSATQVASDIPDHTCPIGWTQFNEACYQFFDEDRSWEDAEATCQYNFGSHLVSIHNNRENRFVTELSQSSSDPYFNLWSGMTKPAQMKKYVWTDGSPVSFANFKYSPRVYQNDHVCVRIYLDHWSFGKWDETPWCFGKNKFICKLRLAVGEFPPNDEISKLPK